MANMDGVFVQSLARGLDVLTCFDGGNSQLGISEIAEKMNLGKSTTYGLVNTLVIKGFLEQNPQTKQYRLGIKLFEYGNLVHNRMNLHNDARPFCEELSQKQDAAVHLAARYGDDVVYIDKIDAPDAIIIYSKIGKRAPMHCTGVGKAILAYLPEEEQQRFFSGETFQRFTEHTITSPEQLKKDLDAICSRGYSVDDEEIEIGLRCIAAPIFNHKNYPVAAISVSAPVARIQLDEIGPIAANVQFYASQISQRLGHNK